MNPQIETANSSRGRILFADDDDLFREGLAAQLRRQGYECICAPDAAAAVNLLRREEFDVLLSDIYMPGNVGLELIESVPQIQFGLPVVLLTGRPTVDTAVKSIRLAVVGYVVKPPDRKELYPLLERATQNYRSCRHIKGSRQRLESWARQLAQVERSLEGGLDSTKAAPVAEYLQLMATNLMSLLEDMEQSVKFLTSLGQSGTDVPGQEFVDVIKRTILALEQTKQCFKSKSIGALRRELEALVGGGRAEAGAQTPRDAQESSMGT
jgi:YesN/AraC family two-component response regulator